MKTRGSSRITPEPAAKRNLEQFFCDDCEQSQLENGRQLPNEPFPTPTRLARQTTMSTPPGAPKKSVSSHETLDLYDMEFDANQLRAAFVYALKDQPFDISTLENLFQDFLTAIESIVDEC